MGEEVVEATAKKISATHGGSGDAGIGGLMRPTKSWLNHLGETGGQSSKGSASLTNGTVNGGTADDGTAVVTRKNSSQKATQETSSSSVSSSSTTSSCSASTNSGKSESSKEKNLPTNNKVGTPTTLTDGKESEVALAKESHSAGEQKEPASKINGNEKIENGKDESRTTMVIQLHPGKTKKLSAYLENHENPGSRTWLTEAETGNLDDAICGLEISFASVPHDIDIKVLPAAEGDAAS